MNNAPWHIEHLHEEGAPPPPHPFTPAVRWGELVFISGQASVDAHGTIVPDTFEGEFRRSLENLRRALVAGGSDLQHVLQVRSYVRDPANVPAYNQLYREYFTAPYPARTTLTNCLPTTLHFEIECVAVRHSVNV